LIALLRKELESRFLISDALRHQFLIPMVHCERGYTTNLPVVDLVGGKGHDCDPV